jgi:hypothetical protein
VEKSMGIFFMPYATMGVIILVGYLIVTIVVGVILGKILNKRWIVAPVFILNLVIFYLLELNISIAYLLMVVVVLAVIYMIKRK